MMRHRAAGRAWIGAAVLVQLFAFSRGAQAQVRDTTAVDTLRADTLRADSLAPPDTVPPPVLVDVPAAMAPVGLASATWVWNREALLNEAAVSVTDLLAQIPGVITFRSGVYLQPEAVSSYGGGPSRLRVEWNGYPLDPLATAALDLSTVELAALSEVRIERRADFLVVRLRSDAPSDARPYSRIEAGVGQPRANVFRGMLLAPRFLVGPIGLAVERVESQGTVVPQPADAFAGWVRWGILSETRGIEFELRSDRVNRDPDSPRPEDLRRQDLMIRARNRFSDGLTGEAYYGRSTLKLDGLSTAIPDSLHPHTDRASDQMGLRAGFERGPVQLEGDIRWRNGTALPRLQTDLAGAYSTSRLSVRLDLARESWAGASSAASYHAWARAPIAAGIAAFGEVATGTSGAAPLFVDSVGSPHVFDRSVYRGGMELTRGRLSAAGSLMRVSTDSVAAIGLPGDTAASSTPGGTVTGWEFMARVPLLGDWLAASGAYTTWFSGNRWTYMPASSGRALLLLNATPLESGNLQFVGRFEVDRRGAMLAPPASTETSPTDVAARLIMNIYIEIRVIDVRVFGRFEDLAGQNIEDLPGLVVRGPRILYGVKWNFWN